MVDVAVAALMLVVTLGGSFVYYLGANNVYAFGAQLLEPYVPGLKNQRIMGQVVAACYQDERGRPQEYADAVCNCMKATLPIITDVMAAQQQCRQSAPSNLASRADIVSKFEQGFDRFCNARTFDPDGRRQPAQVDQYCGCLKKRISSNRNRMASYAYLGGEARNTTALSTDQSVCIHEMPDLNGEGWKIESAATSSVAVLTMPTHPDVRQIRVTCEGDQMTLRAFSWQSARPFSTIDLGDNNLGDDNPPVFSLNLVNGAAKGEPVQKFMQYILDAMEVSGPSASQQFIRKEGRSRVGYLVNLERKVPELRQALAKCLPAAASDSYAKPASGGAQVVNLVKDSWSYEGRMARLFPGPDDKIGAASNSIPLVSAVEFICKSKPALGVAGEYVYEFNGLKERNMIPAKLDIDVTTADGVTQKFSAGCEDAEGAPICVLNPSDAQLGAFAGSSALTFSIKGTQLIAVPFGSAPKIRQVFPACKALQGKQVAALKPVGQLPIAPAPKIAAVPGSSQTAMLASNLNVRATPGTAAPPIKTLSKGTRLVVAPSVDPEWSLVSVGGKEIGFVKNSALSKAQQRDADLANQPSAAPVPKPPPPGAAQVVGAAGCETAWAPRLRKAQADLAAANREAIGLMKLGTLGYDMEPAEKKCRRYRTILVSLREQQEALRSCPRSLTPELVASAADRNRRIAEFQAKQCGQ